MPKCHEWNFYNNKDKNKGGPIMLPTPTHIHQWTEYFWWILAKIFDNVWYIYQNRTDLGSILRSWQSKTDTLTRASDEVWPQSTRIRE